MEYRIPLVVDGIDLNDDATLETIGQSLTDLVWTRESGRVLATLYVTDNPVMTATSAAARIRQAFPQACVHRIDHDLVGVPDIARRVGVTREAVRLWVSGKRGPGRFPPPFGALGGERKGSSQVWAWGDVNAWLHRHYELGDGYRYPSERQYAEILDRITQPGLKDVEKVFTVRNTHAEPIGDISVVGLFTNMGLLASFGSGKSETFRVLMKQHLSAEHHLLEEAQQRDA